MVKAERGGSGRLASTPLGVNHGNGHTPQSSHVGRAALEASQENMRFRSPPSQTSQRGFPVSQLSSHNARREAVVQPSSQRGGSAHGGVRGPSSLPPSGRRIGVASQGDMHRRPPTPLPFQPGEAASQGDHGDGNGPSPLDSLSNEEINKLVAEVMRHMVFKTFQQPGVPVRREELTQIVTKTYKQRSLASSIISRAQSKMRSTFGFEMKEYVRIRSSSKTAAAGPQGDMKAYALLSNVPGDFQKKYIETPDTAAAYSLAVVVIGIIKFSGGERVPEETVLQNLQRFGLEEDRDHPVFGNLKNALDGLAKQRFIQKEKLSGHGHEGDGFVYELAERALDASLQARFDELITMVVPRDCN